MSSCDSLCLTCPALRAPRPSTSLPSFLFSLLRASCGKEGMPSSSFPCLFGFPCFFLLQGISGTKNEPKPKLLSLDIFRWGRGLPHEGVGAKKFGMPLETREIELFWRDIPGFCRDIPGVPEKFEKKKFGFNFRSLEFLACLIVFPFFPRTFRGSEARQNPCFLSVFPCLFQKTNEKKIRVASDRMGWSGKGAVCHELRS